MSGGRLCLSAIDALTSSAETAAGPTIPTNDEGEPLNIANRKLRRMISISLPTIVQACSSDSVQLGAVCRHIARRRIQTLTDRSLTSFSAAVDVHAIGGLMHIVPGRASALLTNSPCHALKTVARDRFVIVVIKGAGPGRHAFRVKKLN